MIQAPGGGGNKLKYKVKDRHSGNVSREPGGGEIKLK